MYSVSSSSSSSSDGNSVNRRRAINFRVKYVITTVASAFSRCQMYFHHTDPRTGPEIEKEVTENLVWDTVPVKMIVKKIAPPKCDFGHSSG